MAERVRVREIANDEGNRLLRIVRRSSGSVVTWRRAQMVLLSAQGMDAAQIAQVTFTSPDRVRDVIHNFNADGFDLLRPKYAGGRPVKFDRDQHEQITQISLARPTDHGLPFSTWSLSKLADYLVAQGVVEDISHEGLRMLLRGEGVSFQAVKTWKTSTDPDYEAKKNRVLQLYAIADGRREPAPGDPDVVICMDEFGPLNLQPHPGRQWAPVAVGPGNQARARRRRRRATYTRPHGVRHLLAGYDLSTHRLYGHVVACKGRTEFLAFCRYLRSLHPPAVRIAIVLDNFSPHLSTNTDPRVGDWPQANDVELAYVPFDPPLHRLATATPQTHDYAKSSNALPPSRGRKLPDAVLVRENAPHATYRHRSRAYGPTEPDRVTQVKGKSRDTPIHGPRLLLPGTPNRGSTCARRGSPT